MQGTITTYKRKGRIRSYGYRFRVKGPDGAWRWITKKGFKTRGEAERAQRNRIIEEGLKPDEIADSETIPTFCDVFERFLRDAGMDCTPGTIENRKHARYALRDFGVRPITSITTAELQQFFASLRTIGGDKGKPLAPKTLKHIRFMLKCVFDTAVKTKALIGTPLTKDVKTPKLRKKKFRMPEKQRLKDVISKARGRRLYPLLAVTAATGLRLGEICALQWPDYDEATGMLEVSKAFEETKLGIRLKQTKSDEPRLVSLPSSAVEALREQRELQQRDKETLHENYDDKGYIFCPPCGGFYRPTKVSSRVSAFLRKNGLALSMHGLRHAHASLLLNQGADVPSVSARLGHADPSITLAVYSHVIPSDRGRLALLWDDDRKAKVVEMFPYVPKKAAK